MNAGPRVHRTVRQQLDGEPESQPGAWSVAVARGWARLYTRGLHEPQRSWRLAELESDLHEHLAHARDAGDDPADTSFEVLLRVLLGVPADLSWRWEISRGVRPGTLLLGRMISMVERALLGLGVAVTTLLGAYFIVNGVGIATGLGRGDGDSSMLLWGVIEVVAGLLLVAGPMIASRRPRIGAGVIVGGTLIITVTHVWLLAFNVPIAIALIAAAVVRSRRIERRGTPAAA